MKKEKNYRKYIKEKYGLNGEIKHQKLLCQFYKLHPPVVLLYLKRNLLPSFILAMVSG